MSLDGGAAGRTPEPARARRGLLAHLRHELGTPLNAIIGYSELLLEDEAAGPGSMLGPELDSVHRTGQALYSLVNEFLESARIDAGLLELPLPVIGAAIRERLRAPLESVLASSERLLQQSAASALPGRVEDLQRIRSAAMQLGTLLDDLTPLDPGSGRRGAARAEMESSADVAIQALVDEGPTMARASGAPAGRQAARLLVVDDNGTNRDILSRILERRGHAVRAAASGREALALLGAGTFDLVLLDILMPEMNGFELLQQVKADPALRQLPVIFISALDDATGKVQAFRAGGVDYVTKPFQAEEVVARVENQLKISRLQIDLARQNDELVRKNDDLVRAQQRTDLVFSALADALPGTVLDGKYRLEEKIGAGGFGAVFRGLHLGLHLPVAIKVFRPIVGNDTPEALERFRQEGIAASRIKHPNAIEILDNGISTTGIAYLVMELMQGHTLAAELKERGALPLERTAAILIPVCEALAEVHAAGIVHRDISPDNIYLHRSKKGEVVKLLDFGLSKMLGTAADPTSVTLTITGSVAGTPAYMAPERLTNSGCDGRSDVYSLGVIMYRMLSGRPPFATAEGGQFALAMMHLTADPPPLPAGQPDAPAGLDALVRRAMAKDPSERPTAGELADLLKGLVPHAGGGREA
jgi:CheY-like chemotaxis protein